MVPGVSLIRDMHDDDAARTIVERLETPFGELVFSEWDPAFLETPEGKHGMRVALVDRYLASRRHAVPWLDGAVGLSGKTVVEVGCGTGSSTVALAERNARVIAIDIDASSVAAARHRVEAHHVDGVTVVQCDAEHILERALEQKADLYVLFAVLEHLTEFERYDMLHGLWNALAPGGAIAIIETPNRLSYFDSHSSEQDFVHLLPDGLAFRLKDHSPRQAYRDVMANAIGMHDEALAHVARVRFGLGASYHEFLAAIDEPLADIVIADGHEAEIMSWFGTNLEETTLLHYMLERHVDVPMAFARSVLNLVIRKPSGDLDRRATARRNEARRQELARTHPRPPINWGQELYELNDRIRSQAEELHSRGAAIPRPRRAVISKFRRQCRRIMSGVWQAIPRPSK